MPGKRDKAVRAFTLIELLVVIAIIGVLAALGLGAILAARTRALRIECSNHLRQIGIGLQQYHDTTNSFPPGMSFKGGEDPYKYMAWHTRLLPFLDQGTLWMLTEDAFKQIPLFTSAGHVNNPPHVGFATVMAVYGCPADSRPTEVAHVANGRFSSVVDVALTSYLGVEGLDQVAVDGVLYRDSQTRMVDVTDGTSNTLMAGERPPSPDMSLGWWYGGAGQRFTGSADSVLGVREINNTISVDDCPGLVSDHFRPGSITDECDIFHFWSLHPGGANFLFVDGSVHFLSYSVDPLLPALASRSGGEAVQLP
jgi:prepilin-type N-terminal cleavage/methylation domain-containing protein/prepilin-type processing-associated H-X9-DG protein